MSIKKNIGNLISRSLPTSIKKSLINAYVKQPSWQFRNISYSQEGEDLILNRIFNKISNGIFVDVGAHHPFRFSNTFYFYLKGWRGINIDPLPGSMDIFLRKGPEILTLK